MNANAQVLIIGSGPAGVAAAWPLLEAGVSVLMVDPADGTEFSLPQHENIDEFRRDPDRARYELAEQAILDETLSPKLSTPFAQAILASYSAAISLRSEGFFVTGSHAAGGLSRIWGALAMRWDADDLAHFPHQGDMALSYERVARRIGLSRTDEDSAFLTEPLERLWARHRRVPLQEGFALEPASNAVLHSSQGDRKPCNACGLCLYGCSKGAIYHSAFELPRLRTFANFDYRPGLLVRRLSNQNDLHCAEAISSSGPVSLTARYVVLAAGTIGTTNLALRRIGLVGQPVRLESNPVGGTGFLVPSLIGRDLPTRSFSLGQLSYRTGLGNGGSAAGVLYGADTLPLSSIAARMPVRGRTAMRLARALAPGLVLASGYLPGRFSHNHIRVDDDGAGGRVTITGEQTAEASLMLRKNFRDLSKALRRRGALALPGSGTILQPGADAHAAATLPIGGQGPTASGPFGELRNCEGIYIADGASLPTLSAIHPTLTIMANADRIGRHLAKHIGA